MNKHDTIITDGGTYTVTTIISRLTTDESIGLCVGRAADGHCDLIASDNARNWLVGDADDHEANHEQWAALVKAGIDLDNLIDTLTLVDQQLGDFAADRIADYRADIEDEANA